MNPMLVKVITPFVGVDNVRFGMNPQSVAQHWGPPDSSDKNILGEMVEYRGSFVATYSARDNLLVEVGFPRTCLDLTINEIKPFQPQKFDRLKELLTIDPLAYEDVGMIVFKHLGISLTGFTHVDDNDVAVTAFAAGRWDDDLAEMEPFKAKN